MNESHPPEETRSPTHVEIRIDLATACESMMGRWKEVLKNCQFGGAHGRELAGRKYVLIGHIQGFSEVPKRKEFLNRPEELA